MKADPRYAQAVGNLASLLEEEGKLTEAMEELRRLLTLAPDNADARLRLAGILRMLENYPEAIESYTAASFHAARQRRRPQGSRPRLRPHRGKAKRHSPAMRSWKAWAERTRTSGSTALSSGRKPGRSRRRRRRSCATSRQSPTTPGRASSFPTSTRSRATPVRLRRSSSRCWRPPPQDAEASFRLAKLQRELGEPQKAIETMEGLINMLEQSTRSPGHGRALARHGGIREGHRRAREGFPRRARKDHPQAPRARAWTPPRPRRRSPRTTP